jgi:hypothetical protein
VAARQGVELRAKVRSVSAYHTGQLWGQLHPSAQLVLGLFSISPLLSDLRPLCLLAAHPASLPIDTLTMFLKPKACGTIQ